MIALSLLILAAVILLLVLWNVIAWPGVTGTPRVRASAVSVLIPARDEEENIGECLDAVMRQGDTVGEILVYDDHSTDGTADIVQDYAERDGRLRLMAPAALPPGWSGKAFACAQLGQAARGDWLLFIDADARLSSHAVPRMIDEAEQRELTLLSCWPGLQMIGWWERMLMPMLNFFVFTLYPAPLSIIRQDASLGLAHGACLLVHRSSYLHIGGHALVRNQLFEDTRLARAWRQHGLRGLCLDGQHMVRVRMYDGFSGIWQGFQKNCYPGFRREISFWLFLAFHAVMGLALFILPVVSPSGFDVMPVAAAAGCVLLTRLLLAWRFGHPYWAVFTHPLGTVMLLAIALSSWWKFRIGKGVVWKDRAYHQAELLSREDR